jgi:hypothetical protein
MQSVFSQEEIEADDIQAARLLPDTPLADNEFEDELFIAAVAMATPGVRTFQVRREFEYRLSRQARRSAVGIGEECPSLQSPSPSAVSPHIERALADFRSARGISRRDAGPHDIAQSSARDLDPTTGLQGIKNIHKERH